MGTHYRGSADEIRALDAYIKLMRAADSVFQRTNGHLAEHSLTPTQFAVLEALYHLGTLSQIELARKLLKSTGNITTVLQHLEARGLVCRQRCASDQRVVEVSLTDAGRAAIERILPDHVRRITADLSVLTPAEQETLAALCRKLGLREAR
ncbi:MAG: MarR family transcriptional regulator [Anaerolinea sp.]|nr:MarR family transcriptional regulator [Anaerolinea sp.]